ncbi:hypothetical protein, partial [Enterobacter hormaechei]|uniref:hypothetical protein n=1 Tax=Enterobacter hormaechei TaxID=158836 RepID=UPI00203D8C8B
GETFISARYAMRKKSRNKSLSDKHPCQMGDIAAHREQKNRRNHDSATLILPYIYLRLNLMCVYTCQLRH